MEEWGVNRVEVGSTYAYYVSPTRFQPRFNAERYPAVGLVKGPVCSKKNPYIVSPGCFVYFQNISCGEYSKYVYDPLTLHYNHSLYSY
jgi:hypothetical protein